MVDDRVKVLIVTEDTGTESFEVLKNLINSILKNIVEDYQSQLIEFKPVEKCYLPVCSGNRWKQEKPHKDPKLAREITAFKKYIVQHTMKSSAFIFWHIDGDMMWAQFARGKECANRKSLDTFIEKVLKGMTIHQRDKVPPTPEGCFLKLLPFYSIEAWLYQNSQALQKITENTGDIQATDASVFDDILKVKEAFKIKAKYNLQLSQSFPFQKVYELGKSFHHTVEELKDASGFLNTVVEKQNDYLQQWN